MEINVLKLVLNTEINLKRNDAEKIRGYLGNLFWDNPYAHQHNPDGRLIYRYPCVQYKIINGNCLLIGFNEGVEVVKETFHSLKSINLNGRWEEILGKGLEGCKAHFAIASEQISYSFLTPWLALNQKNYQTWQGLSKKDKQEKLNRILIGNILSMAKGLNYVVTEEIKAEVDVKPVPTTLKGVSMVGFLGEFQVNFNIPDYLGLGKSVSRGFGTVVQNRDY